MTLFGSELIAFVSTTDPVRAAGFYRDTLGLQLVSDTPFALVFDAGGTMLRVSVVEHLDPASFTVLGWAVTDLVEVIGELATRGVEFLHYHGLDQDARGIWQTPSGARIAWFTDSDGNVLSLTQF
jgi:catechol 2,3-dioxygenase-like lactoylglutathione lyase family enzyme